MSKGLNLRDLLEEYLLEIRLKKYSERTIKSVKNNTALFFSYLEKQYNIITLVQRNPRDLKTHLKKEIVENKESEDGKWFYAESDGEIIYITEAHHHKPSSTLSSARKLGFKEFERIYPIHIRREQGECVSQEATDATRNQVYWFSLIYNGLDKKNF